LDRTEDSFSFGEMITVEERWRLYVPYEPPSPWRAHAWVAGVAGGAGGLLFFGFAVADGGAATILAVGALVSLSVAATAAAAGAVRTILFRNALKRRRG
jgi:hypothetical protein